MKKHCDTQLLTSELIVYLEKSLNADGDLPIRFILSGDPDPVFADSLALVGFSTILDDKDKPRYLLLGGHTMIDAFK